MGKAKLVNAGVDTLVLNAFYTDERGRPVKYDLEDTLRLQLDAWKREAQAFHEECATPLVFNEALLRMCHNGVRKGQYPWMLKTKDMTLYISGGHWNGIAAVRFSSQYLWSCRSIRDAIVTVQAFLNDLFKQAVYLQVSLVDLCVDVAGWDDVESWQRMGRICRWCSIGSP